MSVSAFWISVAMSVFDFEKRARGLDECVVPIMLNSSGVVRVRGGA